MQIDCHYRIPSIHVHSILLLITKAALPSAERLFSHQTHCNCTSLVYRISRPGLLWQIYHFLKFRGKAMGFVDGAHKCNSLCYTHYLLMITSYDVDATDRVGCGLLNQFLPFPHVFSQICIHYYLVFYGISGSYMTGVAVTPVRYGHDSNALACTFPKPDIPLKDKLMEF